MNTKKKILLIDDDENITKLMSYSLQVMGYATLTLNDSRNALETTKSYKPDLVILDFDMPIMDGGEVMRRMRNDAEVCDTPIIFLTGLATERDVHGRNHDMSEIILPKPISMHDLAKEIERKLMKPGH